ncbi:MAG: hypothetical protein IPH39_19070 [Sulfuritalea sp.]|nr:hypothetical protein [Sulfuritalea sp.]
MASPAAFREPPPKPMFSPAAIAPASVLPAQVESDATLQLMAANGIKSRDGRPDRLVPRGGDSEGRWKVVARAAGAFIVRRSTRQFLSKPSSGQADGRRAWPAAQGESTPVWRVGGD